MYLVLVGEFYDENMKNLCDGGKFFRLALSFMNYFWLLVLQTLVFKLLGQGKNNSSKGPEISP